MNRTAFKEKSFDVESFFKKTSNIIYVVVALIIFMLVYGSWYTIDERERGVVTRYGKVVDVAVPGLGFKIPVLDKINKISVQDHVEVFTNLATYSRDQQPATMTISVSYRLDQSRIDEIFRVYSNRAGVIDRLVTRKVLEESKTVFGRFNAVSSIQERGRLNQEMAEAIQKSIDGPVIVIGVQVEDIDFSDAYEASIEARMLAEVSVQRELQNHEREKVQADIVRTQAQANADKVRLNAQAEADAIKLKGEAEAQAITARTEALKNNAALIELVKAERWDGKLPTHMLPNQTIPFIDVNK